MWMFGWVTDVAYTRKPTEPGATLKTTIKISGFNEVRAMFVGLDAEFQDMIKAESLVIGNFLAGRIKTGLQRSHNPQAALFIPTIKVGGGKVPNVSIGKGALAARQNRKRVGRATDPRAILFATEFGLNPVHGHGRGIGAHGFGKHTGRDGYAFFPAIDAAAPSVAQMWKDAVGRTLVAANNATQNVSAE